MHRDFVRAVRGHRQVEGLGQVGDLHEGGDAAAVRHVGFRKADAARRDQLPELPDASQVLAGGDRQPAFAKHPRVAGRVVGHDGLLEPQGLEGLQRAGRPDRLVDAPLHVGVDHQRKVGAEVPAHGPHALDVLGQPIPAHLHLDRPEAAGEVALGLRDQRADVELQVDAARVAGNRRIESAEQVPEREPGAARLEIPQRDVGGRQREHRRAAPSAIVQRPPALVPAPRDVVRLATAQQLGDLDAQRGVDRGAVAPDGEGVAEALRAVGVADPDRVQLEGADVAVRAVRDLGLRGNPEMSCFDRFDPRHGRLHRCRFLTPGYTRSRC